MAEMTVAQAARTLGISEDTVRRRVKRGEMTTSMDALGRLRVVLDQMDELAPDQVESAANGAGAAGAAHAEVALLRSQVALLERERETLATELASRRQELESATHEKAELLTALRQQQTLHAQAAGLKLISDGEGRVQAIPVDAADDRPRRTFRQVLFGSR